MKSIVKLFVSSLGFCAAAALFPLAHAQDSAPSAAAPTAPATAPATSNDDAPPPPRAKKGKGRGMMNPLAGVSNVTDDQKAKVDAIMQDMRTQMQAIDPDERREKMPALMQATMAKVKAVLTPDQQTQFDANMAKMRNRRKKGGDNGDAPPPPPPQN